jgi:hypothetical protein
MIRISKTVSINPVYVTRLTVQAGGLLDITMTDGLTYSARCDDAYALRDRIERVQGWHRPPYVPLPDSPGERSETC